MPGPFPQTTILDDAVRANEGPPPSAAWTSSVDSDDGGLKVVSNKIAPDTETSSALWNQAFPADQEVFVQVDALMEGGPDSLELFLNIQNGDTTTPSGYIFRFWSQTGAGVGRLELDRMDSGSFTRLVDVAQTIVVGDQLGARNEGGTLRFYVNGVEKTSATDSTYGTGQIGIGTRADNLLTTRFSKFGGGQAVPQALHDWVRRQPAFGPGGDWRMQGRGRGGAPWRRGGARSSPHPGGGFERVLFSRLHPVYEVAGATHFGAFDLALTLTTDTFGRLGAKGSFSLPLTFTFGTNGVRTRFGSFALPLTFAFGTKGFHAAFGRTIGLALSLSIFTNGVRTRFGSFALPLTFAIGTKGARAAFGSFSLPLTLSIATAGKDTKRGSTSLPLTLNIATAGTASHFATLDLPLVFTFGTAGFIEGQVDEESLRLRADKERLEKEPWPQVPKSPKSRPTPYKPGYMRKKVP